MPVIDGCRLTSGFGKRNISYGPNDHWGLDFGGVVAGQSVYVKAAADGFVRFIGPLKYRSDPRNIGIEHPDGSLTLYAHTRNQKVKVGQKVSRGEIIAETWWTGLKSINSGIHLHFEWWSRADDHTSVFDPRAKLAEYGWTLRWDESAKKYRMLDSWEGRSTKTPEPEEPMLDIVLSGLTTEASVDKTTSQETPVLTPDQNSKLTAVHTSTSTPVVTDQSGTGDKVTVAGGIQRLLTLVRRIDSALTALKATQDLHTQALSDLKAKLDAHSDGPTEPTEPEVPVEPTDPELPAQEG